MKISEALHEVDLLAIDTVAYIYYVEDSPTYADKMETIFRLVIAQSIEILSSIITLTEVLSKPMRDSDTNLQEKYRDLLLRTHHINVLPVTANVAIRAAELRAKYNLRTPDAIHVATAITGGCDAFLTNDAGIKRITEIRVLVLDDLELNEPSKE